MTEYCRFFRNKVLQVSGMTAEEQIFAFCRQLDPQMRAEIMSKRPETLDACMYTTEVVATARREWNKPLGARPSSFKRKRFRPWSGNEATPGVTNAAGPTPMELDYVHVRGNGRLQRRGQFPQQGLPPRGVNNPKIRCFLCRRLGHLVSKCPNRPPDIQLHGLDLTTGSSTPRTETGSITQLAEEKVLEDQEMDLIFKSLTEDTDEWGTLDVLNDVSDLTGETLGHVAALPELDLDLNLDLGDKAEGVPPKSEN